MACYIIILNYNTWEDTIECIESVLKSDYQDIKVVVCDNHSENQSLTHLEKWAQGNESVSCIKNAFIRKFIYPLVPKPLIYQKLDEKDVRDNSAIEAGILNFIANSANKGFAGGMNVGIRFALNQHDCQYIWCLNNDTVVAPDALKKMIITTENNRNIGICSSRSYYYDAPDEEQWLIHRTGFNKWLCISSSINDSALKRQKMASYNGASFVVTAEFVKKVGLMEEKYFLYCEEWDWTIRGKKAGFKLAFATDSRIYHKQGRTTGGTEIYKSYTADYYGVRSKILFTRKFYPYCIPTVYIGLIAAIVNRIRRKQYNRVGMILKLMLNPYPTLK